MSGPSRAECLGECGKVVAHISKIKQTAVRTRLVVKMMMKEKIVGALLACCKRIPGRSPSFPSLITFCSQGNLFPSSLFLPTLPSSQGNLLFSPTFPSCFPEPARKLLPTFSGESRRPSPFWKLDPPGEISRGPRSSDEYGCCTGE